MVIESSPASQDLDVAIPSISVPKIFQSLYSCAWFVGLRVHCWYLAHQEDLSYYRGGQASPPSPFVKSRPPH